MMDAGLARRISEAAATLRAGGVVAFPTESSYGLAVDARSEAALARLFALKHREPKKPPPLLVTGEAMLATLATELPAAARRLIAKFWPGPLTLVVPARPDLPGSIVSDGGVGARQSPHPIATALVTALGGPITATSANPSGAPPALDAAEVSRYFGASLLVIDGGAAPGGAPSTVVQVLADGRLVLLRAGAVDPARLAE